MRPDHNHDSPTYHFHYTTGDNYHDRTTYYHDHSASYLIDNAGNLIHDHVDTPAHYVNIDTAHNGPPNHSA